MTQSYYTTETFDKEHRHFGGIIYPSDFNTEYRGENNTNGSPVASRITSDFKWEQKTLKKNKEKK